MRSRIFLNPPARPFGRNFASSTGAGAPSFMDSAGHSPSPCSGSGQTFSKREDPDASAGGERGRRSATWEAGFVTGTFSVTAFDKVVRNDEEKEEEVEGAVELVAWQAFAAVDLDDLQICLQ